MTKQTLIEMLELSALSYSTLPICKTYRYDFVQNKATDTECFIKSGTPPITIVFRGTDSQKNRASNFLFCKRTIPYGNTSSKVRVHNGFLQSYKSVRKKIHAAIPKDPCKIIVCGHSLGGALAVLCGVDLQYNFPGKDIEVYTFGSPRVGNKHFSKSYNKRVFKTYRSVNGNDIVTKLPPALFGYRHVGIPLHYGMLRLPFLFSFEAHKPTEYFKSIFEK